MSQINLANMQFAAFVNFANSSPNAAKSTAIAALGADKADGGDALAGRKISPKPGNDYVGKLSRSDELKAVNNEVRAVFKAAVAEMFGGEDNIPASVKNVMKLGDYNKGKPLTARRIIAVNNAIEKLKVGSFTLKDAFAAGRFEGELKKKAEDAGHNAKDFKKLNIGANLLAKATGMPLRSALLEIMDKSSAAYACLKCGPLYTGSVADFKKGLAEFEKFKSLQNDLIADTRHALAGGGARDFAAIARKRVEQLKIARQQFESVFAMQTVVGGSCPEYKALMTTIDAAIKDFEKAAKDIDDGLVDSEEDLYARTIGNKKMNEVTGAFSRLGPVLFKNRNAGGNPELMQEVMSAMNHVNHTCVAIARDSGNDAFKHAFSDREAPKLAQRFREAERAGGFKLPGQFYDSIDINLGMHLFNAVDAFKQMAAKLGDEGERSKVLFSDSQKARLKAVIAEQAGQEAASRLLGRFVGEIEAIRLNDAFGKTMLKSEWDAKSIENLVAHFEKHPGLAKAFALGFKEDRIEDVKADLKNVMAASFDKAMKTAMPNVSTLEPGFMPQAIREYNKGYVTFNGKPLRDGVSGKQFMLADTDFRKGYCEFLEEKFDDRHVQMRRFVSFVCGMADGLSGAISNGAFTGSPEKPENPGNPDGAGLSTRNNPDLVKSPQRNCGYYLDECKGNVAAGPRDERDNYDIRIDEKTGDVTIKFTHYETNCLAYYMDDKNNTVALAKADKSFPEIATTRFEVTMVIKNAPDTELKDSAPEFKITDIKQKVIED